MLDNINFVLNYMSAARIVCILLLSECVLMLVHISIQFFEIVLHRFVYSWHRLVQRKLNTFSSESHGRGWYSVS